MNYYTIYDVDAQECGNLYPAKNDTLALRGFKAFLASENVSPDVLPKLKCYKIGVLDVENMIFTPHSYEVIGINKAEDEID